MANRNFNRVQAIDKEVKHIYGQFLITDGVGTVQFDAAEQTLSVGVKNVERDSGGKFTITLGVPGGATDKYPSLLFMQCFLTDSAAISTNGGVSFQIETDDITNGIIKLFALDKDGAIAEIRSGDVLQIMIVVKNSNQPGVGVS